MARSTPLAAAARISGSATGVTTIWLDDDIHFVGSRPTVPEIAPATDFICSALRDVKRRCASGLIAARRVEARPRGLGTRHEHERRPTLARSVDGMVLSMAST